MHNADFVLADQPWTRCTAASFLRNCGKMPEMYTCFVDLEKAYDHVARDKLWVVLLKYDIGGQLLATIKSSYKQSEVCVHVNYIKTKPFSVSVGLQ